jgi:hypothetical protein
MLVSSVPFSPTQRNGLQRRAAMASNSRATRAPNSDVSAARHRHSRVKSSTTIRMRKRRPSVSVSAAKSNDHRSFAACGSVIVFACARHACVQRNDEPTSLLRDKVVQFLVVHHHSLPVQQHFQVSPSRSGAAPPPGLSGALVPLGSASSM